MSEAPAWTRRFVGSVVVLMIIAAGAKLVGAGGAAPLLSLVDPVFGLPNGLLMQITALVEFALAGLLLYWGAGRLSLLGVLWFASSVLVYRVASSFLAPGRPCPCLGSLTERLHLSPQSANALLYSIVFYMLIGATAGLWGGRLQQR